MQRLLRSPTALLASIVLATIVLAARERDVAVEPRARAVALAGDHAAGFATITLDDVTAHARVLGSPAREGRDTPSQGLEEAARYVADRFRAAGLASAPDAQAYWKKNGESDASPSVLEADGGTYRRPFRRTLPAPDRSRSHLRLEVEGSPAVELAYGADFVPLAGCAGSAHGEIVFAGFGIASKSEHYDEIEGLRLRGTIALVIDGEPDHAQRFDGPEITRAASFAAKLDDLAEAGAAGVLLVRRAPPPFATPKGARPAPAAGGDASDIAALGFRHAPASFVGADVEADMPSGAPPALEITAACATKLLGEDVLELAERIERTLAPARAKSDHRKVALSSAVASGEVRADNVVGLVRGSDLAGEYVVVGAHYDHLGIDRRGRIAPGADDNASGTAALIEIAEALAVARPRRSVLLCAFAGEEHGLLGSRAFCADPPVPKDSIVAMINMDMIGRGDRAGVALLGIVQNPAFEKLVGRAKKLKATGVQEVVMRKGEELFERSDHFSFHSIGVPSLFFFEGLPLSKNPDYHTWRDTLDKLDFEKMLRTTRLVYNTAWLLATEDAGPPRR